MAAVRRVDLASDEDSAALAACFSRAVARVRHCSPCSAATFAREMREQHGGLVTDRAIWLAEEEPGGACVGYIEVAVLARAVPSAEPPLAIGDGAIRFLALDRGHRAAGEALLDSAERHLRERGAERVVAFSSSTAYPFYFLDSAGLSSTQVHVSALLGLRGYENTKQDTNEAYLDWRDFELSALPPPPAPEQGISFRVDVSDEGPGRLPSATVWAISDEDGSEIGQVECVNACRWVDEEATLASDAECQEWFFVTHMAVPPVFTDDHAFQGKGVGQLLLGEAFRRLRAMGYRHSCISTDRANNRALLFYSNFGYETVEWTHSYTLASLNDSERKPVLRGISWRVQGELPAAVPCVSAVLCLFLSGSRWLTRGPHRLLSLPSPRQAMRRRTNTTTACLTVASRGSERTGHGRSVAASQASRRQTQS
jgi:GNAT superfamily N-acetyltransferase